MHSCSRSCLSIVLLAPLTLCQPAFSQIPTSDFLPLAVGNAWTYDYFVQDDRTQGDEYTSDTGRATYTIVSMIAASDSTVWTFKEVRNVRHFYSFFFDHTRDTNYLVNDSTTFEVVERDSGQHRLVEGGANYLMWRTVFAFTKDLSEYFGTTEFFRYYPETVQDTLRVRAEISPGVPVSDSLVVVLERLTGVREIFFSEHRFTGSARAFHHKLFSATVTSLLDPQFPHAPSNFNLHQNYPNPFNPTTTIRYALPRRSHVTLAVFNLLGQKVAELVNGQTDAGYHSIQFDASNLASGVYIYRLTVGAFVSSRKMLFIK